MRCPTRSFALLLCIIPAVLGSAVSSRKNHFKRSYSYTCANLSGQELIVQESDGSSYDAGAIGGCACASQTWVENNLSGNPDPAIYNAEQEVGLDETVSVVSGMVTGSSSAQTCNYPDHALDACRATSVCNFVCQDGYSKSGSDCVCRSPKVVCNGVCQSATTPCSTGGMRKRDLPPKSVCPEGLLACGVRGARRAWECVDTKYDVESCGGCRLPLPKSLQRGTEVASPRGQDCTAIKGAKKTFCDEGVCKVVKCKSGYFLRRDKKACVELGSLSDQTPRRETHFNGPWA